MQSGAGTKRNKQNARGKNKENVTNILVVISVLLE